ncbi:MAG: hypothetical protein ACYSSP_08985 [Planctomycetota bacterium]|jgi:hypothetical protein
MNVKYRYCAFTALFSVFFCISVSLGAINTSGIEIVVDKDVLDSSDFAVIDDFVADGLNELLKTTDFASVASVRSTILRYRDSKRASAKEQYSSQFLESSYRHLGQAFSEVDLIESKKQRERVLLNLLILLDSLGDLRLTEYAVERITSENRIIRYWAINCVSNASIVEQMNTSGADSLLMAKEISGHLSGQIEQANAEELALILRFAEGVNLQDGKEILLRIADIRISGYANWKVDYELLDATLLNSLYNEFSTSIAEEQKAIGKRFCVLFSYVIQRYIKGADRLNEMHKRYLASVMVEIERNCVSKLLNQPQTTMQRAIEGNSMIGLLQEHNRLLGDETSAGVLSKRLNVNYGNEEGSNRTYPPELPEPPQN